jgi:TonB family protein
MKLRNPLISINRWLSIASLSTILLLSAHANAQSPDLANADAKVLSSPPFVLSQEAIDAGIDGTLSIAATLDSTGTVTSARAIAGLEWPCGKSPNKETEKVKELVISNVKQSKFSPEIKDGKPVGTEIGLNFWVGGAYKDLMKKHEVGDLAKISGGQVNGKARYLPKPAYPLSARDERASGMVKISVLIDETGKVTSAGALGGHPLLHSAARDAACGARFAPTTLQGKPVRVSGFLTYMFVAPH